MPYIKKLQKDALASRLEILNDRLRWLSKQLSEQEFDGIMNYVITTLLDTQYERRYSYMKDVLGTLEAVKLEYYRRVMGPYEDKKCVENGDVYRPE